jgi:hypothetical protein
MSELTKGQLRSDNNSSFPNNNAQAITPTILRDYNGNIIDSLVDEITYQIDSGSWNAQIAGIEHTQTGSLLTTASFDNGTRDMTFTKGDGNTFTTNIPGSSLDTGSLLVTASVVDATTTYTKGDGSVFTTTIDNVVNATSSSHAENADVVPYSGISNKPTLVSGSSQVSYPDLSNIPSGILSGSITEQLPSGVVSGSVQVSYPDLSNIPAGIVSSSAQISDITGSSLVTASFATQTLTFTKGDGTTFGVVIPDVSGSDITSLNAFTASQEGINTGYNTFTSSIQVEVDGLSAATSSYLTELPTGVVSGSSQLTSSYDTRYQLSGSDAPLPSGVISGSSQVDYPSISNIPSGIISGSEQLPAGVVSGSSQVDVTQTTNYGVVATTGSNSFIGNQTIEGNLVVSSSTQIEFTGSSIILDTSPLGGIILKPGTDIQFQGNTLFSGPVRAPFVNVDNALYYGFNNDIEGRIYQGFSGSVDSRINGVVAGTGFATTGSNTFNGDQVVSGSLTIQDTNAPMSGLVLKNNSGGGDIQIIPAGDYITTFNDSSITGITNYGGNTISGSWGTVGDITGPGIGIQNADLSGSNQGIYLSHGNYDSWVSAPNGSTIIKGETIQLQPSSSAATSVQVTGDVSASVFTGSFVGDGSGLTNIPTAAGIISGSVQVDVTQTTNYADVATQAGNNIFSGSNSFASGITQNFNGTNNIPTINGDVILSDGANGSTFTVQGTANGGARKVIVTTADVQATNDGVRTAFLSGNYGSHMTLYNSADDHEVGFIGDSNTFSGDWSGSGIMNNADPGNSYQTVIGFQDKNSYTDNRVSILTPLAVINSASFESSASFQAAVTMEAELTVKGNLNVSGSGGVGGDVVISDGANGATLTVQGTANGGARKTQMSAVNVTATNNGQQIAYLGGAYGSYVTMVDTVSNDEIGFVLQVQSYAVGGPSWTGPGITNNSDPGNNYGPVIGWQDKSTYTDNRTTFLTPAEFQAGIDIKKSVQTNPTSVTPDVSNNITIDFSETGIVEVTLTDNVANNFLASNVSSGQTINVKITQAPTTAGTVTFDSVFKQPSGSLYVATTDLGATDILTLTTYTSTTDIYVTAVNKFI